MSGDHPNYCIIEIDQNTERSPGCCYADKRKTRGTQKGLIKKNIYIQVTESRYK